MSFLDSLFNMADKKDLKQFSKIADQIDAAGEKYSAMTDEELQAMTPEFKERLKNGQTLDDTTRCLCSCEGSFYKNIGYETL